jgi:hypothetical protein
MPLIINPTESLAIVTSPPAISSAYRPVLFRLQSTVLNAELKVKAEVYVRNDPSKQLVLVGVKMEDRCLGFDYFQFDFSSLLQAYLSVDKLNIQPLALVVPNLNSVVEYQVTFREVYNNSAGFPTEYAHVTSTALKAVNATLQHEQAQDLTPYIISGMPSKSFGSGFSNGFN